MKVIRKRSEELQETILGNPQLLKALSDKIAEVLGDRIKLPGNATYVFVPQVYRRPTFWPEVYAAPSSVVYIPFGGAGPLDPHFALKLDQDRIAHQIPQHMVRDANPLPAKVVNMRMEILRDPELFLPLSEGLAGVLAEHGIKFARDETYAFIPVMVKKPLFSGELVAINPQPEPPGILFHGIWQHHHAEELEYEFDPGVIIDGIPAPEVLQALEQQRIAYG